MKSVICSIIAVLGVIIILCIPGSNEIAFFGKVLLFILGLALCGISYELASRWNVENINEEEV